MDIKFEMIIVYFLGLASGVFVVLAFLFMRKINRINKQTSVVYKIEYLDAKQLRSGNLIYEIIDTPNDPKFKDIFEVAAINSLTNTVIDKYDNITSLEYCEPIPLTEDWFPKVDFELHNDYVYPKGDNKYNFCLKKIDGKYYYGASHYNGSFEIKSTAIEYVHRLQNIWFDTTGEELEFKL